MSLAWFHQQAQQQRVPTDLPCYLDANKQQRQLIAELESKNRLGMTAWVLLLPSFLYVSSFFLVPQEIHSENKGSLGLATQPNLKAYLVLFYISKCIIIVSQGISWLSFSIFKEEINWNQGRDKNDIFGKGDIQT